MRAHNIIVLLNLAAIGVYAQLPEIWQRAKAQYPDEPAIYLERAETLNLLVNRDSLTSFTDVNENILFLKENIEQFAKKNVHGSDFEKVSNLVAKTLIWTGSRYKELAVSDFKKKRANDNSIFFDDSYYYTFSFPSAASGNQAWLSYRIEHKDPRFLSGYYITQNSPQLKSVFSVKTSKGVELVYEVLHDDKNLVRFRRYEKGNYVYYEWIAEGVTSFRSEEDSPGLAYYLPQVQIYVKSFQTSHGTRSVLADLNDLYQWYGTFVKGLDQNNSPELQAVVDAMKSPGITEMEMVKKVFYWVQDNIRYIAFEDGMRGQIPHTGSYAFEKRYGDCKDMANLVVTMLRMAGISSYRTWIGTRDLPYRYTHWPTPLVDNHMIATYVGPDHRYYFLDATGSHTPFGFPSSMIQGKEALIGKDKDTYEIKEVPEVSMKVNFSKDSVELELDKGNITGKGKKSFDGYLKVSASYELDKAREESIRNNVIKLIGKGSNKFFLDNFHVSDLDNRDKPLMLDYQFRVVDYIHQAGDELYVNLNLEKDFYNQYISANRETPRENEFRYTKEEIYILTIPEGYVVKYLPPDSKLVGKALGFEVRYSQRSNRIVMEKVIYLDFLMLDRDQFADWNASVKGLSEVYKESVILGRK